MRSPVCNRSDIQNLRCSDPSVAAIANASAAVHPAATDRNLALRSVRSSMMTIARPSCGSDCVPNTFGMMPANSVFNRR